MRVWDAETAIYRDLQALPWLRYLSAMWMLCVELQDLYADQLAASERSLAAATLDVIRDVVTSGNSALYEGRAAELAARWGQVINDGERRASGGLLRAWTTFEGAASEIAGESTRFYAADWVVGAAVRRWRDEGLRSRRRLDPHEEVADDSQMAQTLEAFQRLVGGVARASDPAADPAALRTQILDAGG